MSNTPQYNNWHSEGQSKLGGEAEKAAATDTSTTLQMTTGRKQLRSHIDLDHQVSAKNIKHVLNFR